MDEFRLELEYWISAGKVFPGAGHHAVVSIRGGLKTHRAVAWYTVKCLSYYRMMIYQVLPGQCHIEHVLYWDPICQVNYSCLIENGLIKVKEEGWTGFSNGWQGCSEGSLYIGYRRLWDKAKKMKHLNLVYAKTCYLKYIFHVGSYLREQGRARDPKYNFFKKNEIKDIFLVIYYTKNLSTLSPSSSS